MVPSPSVSIVCKYNLDVNGVRSMTICTPNPIVYTTIQHPNTCMPIITITQMLMLAIIHSNNFNLNIKDSHVVVLNPILTNSDPYSYSKIDRNIDIDLDLDLDHDFELNPNPNPNPSPIAIQRLQPSPKP